MNKDISVRSAKLDDWSEIQRLNRQIFEFEFETCEPTSNLSYPDSAEGIDYFRKSAEGRDNHEAIIAEFRGYVVGYAVLKIIPDSEMTHRNGVRMAQLHTLSVDEKFRDRGIGAILIAAAKERAKELGANRMKVVAYAPNDRARYLYKKAGFFEHEIVHEAKI